MRMSESVSRRAALKALGATAGAVTLLPWLSDDGLQAFAGIQRAGARPAPKALNGSQYATLDVLVDAIIPTDERSPGAREARVADYIDLLLSEADAEVKQRWLDGLAAVNGEALARFGGPVTKLSAAQVETLLAGISTNERAPQTPPERFFVMTKQATIQGYYTSEIGIHQDLRYKGNQFLPDFHGCQTEDGRDCPHCGQKALPRAGNAAPAV
jgi:Gluconate 2-dehydrogenase subunit 3